MMIPVSPSLLCTRIATAATITPTLAGVSASAKALAVVGLCSAGATGMGLTGSFMKFDYLLEEEEEELPSVFLVSKTFLRSLIVPSLVEEVWWRVVLQPPGMSWTGMVVVNAAFCLSHIVASTFLAERLEGRPGARTVFRDPAFLLLAFLLGNACSFAHVKAGRALWAPVVVHAIPVTAWLTCFGGERALSTAGGLQPRRRDDNESLELLPKRNDENEGQK